MLIHKNVVLLQALSQLGRLNFTISILINQLEEILYFDAAL